MVPRTTTALTQAECDALRTHALVVPGRLREAAAGGGGRRRRKAPRPARPRLSRRERRVVNDCLLQTAGPVASAAEAKSLFDLRPRDPLPFAVLGDAAPPASASRARITSGAIDRRVRLLVKYKGAYVRPMLAAIEDDVRKAAARREHVTLALDDPLERLLAHAVAQYCCLLHRSVVQGAQRVVCISPPDAPRPLPLVRMGDLLA